MAPKTNQFTYDFNKDKPLQKSNGLVYSKKVPFDHLPSFETVVNFTIKDNDTPPYDDGLVFYIDPLILNPAPTPATGGNLGSGWGSHAFGVLVHHNSDNPDYLNLEIFINYTSRSSVLVPKEFLGKELTLTAFYAADTHEIKVSITDGSKPFQVILTYDLGLILIKDLAEVGLITSPSNVVVSNWQFIWTQVSRGEKNI